MKLLVDLGNSRLKWAVKRNGALHVGQPIDYKSANFLAVLVSEWQDLQQPDELLISSVADKSALTDLLEFIRHLWPGIVITLPQAQAYYAGLKNAYVPPQKLGVDRWLAMLAAKQSFPTGACVVDCGTALTVDVVDGNGIHLGGLISPGLSLMRTALAQGTAALPLINPQRAVGLANLTEAAIDSGVVLAAVGLIETAIRRYADNLPLLLCGGDAPLLSHYLQCDYVHDNDLVLKGLALYCKQKEQG